MCFIIQIDSFSITKVKIWGKSKGHPYVLLLSRNECYTYLGSKRLSQETLKSCQNYITLTQISLSQDKVNYYIEHISNQHERKVMKHGKWNKDKCKTQAMDVTWGTIRMKTELLTISYMHKTLRNKNFFLKASSITNRPRTVDTSRQNGPLLCWIIFKLGM
jgi:oligoribonuclease NrnB/cAMP/cGMP phosphodiesterase (DHH superfamily)